MKQKRLAIVEKLKQIKWLDKLKQLRIDARLMTLFERVKKGNGFRLQFAHVLMAGTVAVIGLGVYLGYRIIVPYKPQAVTQTVNPGFGDFQKVHANPIQRSDNTKLITNSQSNTLAMASHATKASPEAQDGNTDMPANKANTTSHLSNALTHAHESTAAVDKEGKGSKVNDQDNENQINKENKENKENYKRVASSTLAESDSTIVTKDHKLNEDIPIDAKQQVASAKHTVPDHAQAPVTSKQVPANDTLTNQVDSESQKIGQAHTNSQIETSLQTGTHAKVLNQSISALEQQVSMLSEQQKRLLELVKTQQQMQEKQQQQLAQKAQQRQNKSIDSLISGNDITAQKLQQMYEMLHALMMKNTLIKNPLSLVAVVGNYAWLQNNKGVTQSITLGSKIDGYGEVLKIDDQKNQVLMSSGYIFK
ncbi:hypothetical protein [Cysteiniphilum sp. 6C5]|uniref:hypothetical protein n=1 Tax=unclassified Cysteiniphilum TaxID=2610889 RepID=UPI003F87F5E2